MTITNNVNNLYNRSKVLYKQLKSKPSISSSEALGLSSELVQLRKLSDTLLKEKIFPSLNEEDFSIMGRCRKLLYKSQSLLLKKIDPVVLLSSQFHEKVSQVWSNAASEKPFTFDFGKQYSTKFPKDPITLEGLNHYLIRSNIEQWMDALSSENNAKASSLFKSLPKEVSALIEKTIIEIQTNQNKNTTEQPLSASNLLNKIMEQIEDKTPKIYETPIIHHTLNTATFGLVKLLNDDDSLRLAFQRHLWTTTGIRLLTRGEVRDYLFKNANDPFVSYSVLSIQLKSNLIEAQKMLEKNDWKSARSLLSKLLDPAHTILIKHIASLKKTSPSPSILIEILNSDKADPQLLNALGETIAILKDRIEKNPPQAPGKKEEKFIATFTVGDSLNTCKHELICAYEAMVYALRKIVGSANFINREEKVFDTSLNNSTPSLLQFLNKVREKYGFETTAQYVKKKPLSSETTACIYSDRKTIEEFPIGNCRELSHLAFEYLSRQHKDLFIESIYIPAYQKNLDHLFILINRDPKSDLNDPTTWGDKAVVLDCWTRMIYPASEIKSLLQNWTETNEKTGFIVTNPFAFKNQSFKIVTQNVMPYEFYKRNEGIILPELEKSLEEFHFEKASDKRVPLANKCLQILEQFEGKLLPIMETLRSQLHFYLFSKLPKSKTNSDLRHALNN